MITAHARLAPSAAHRWLQCPASVRAESAFEERTSIYAAEGSAAHDLAASVLKGSHSSPFDDVGKSVYHDDFEIPVTQEMAENVERYVDYVRALACEIHWIEHTLDMRRWFPDCWGTADFIGLTADGTLHVVDLKYGKGERIEVEDNPQFLLYGLGAYALLEHLDVKRITIHVFQPRIDNINAQTYSIEALLQWAEDQRPSIALIDSDNAPFHPGTRQCRWCKAKATCTALADRITGEIRHGYASPAPDADTSTRSEVDLAHAMALVNLARNWANAIETRATEQLTLGFAVAGFKLVEGRSVRQWIDECEAETTLRKAIRRLPITTSDLYVKKLISPRQAEKRLGRKKFADFSRLVIKPKGKAVIAPESDKRPAINPADALGFTDLNQPTRHEV